MIQALLHARKKLFAPSTEEMKQIEGQLFLFEEAQKLAEELGMEQKNTVRPYTRTQGNLKSRQRCSPVC